MHNLRWEPVKRVSCICPIGLYTNQYYLQDEMSSSFITQIHFGSSIKQPFTLLFTGNILRLPLQIENISAELTSIYNPALVQNFSPYLTTTVNYFNLDQNLPYSIDIGENTDTR